MIQPTDGILTAGSGGGYALAAARALALARRASPPSEIVRKSLEIAGGIDIYTNGHLTVEELACPT